MAIVVIEVLVTREPWKVPHAMYHQVLSRGQSYMRDSKICNGKRTMMAMKKSHGCNHL